MEDWLIDGDYKTEIILEGGSGRAAIQSPADIHVENGVITAEIIWNSPSYSLMIVGDKEYERLSGGSRQSVFNVEIPSLDTPLEIKAETTAMSTPRLIDYKITVSSKVIENDEILTDDSSITGSAASESLSLTSEEIQSMLDTMISETASANGSAQTIFSATVETPAENNKSGGIPPLAVIGISAALGAAVAYVAFTVGRKKWK